MRVVIVHGASAIGKALEAEGFCLGYAGRHVRSVSDELAAADIEDIDMTIGHAAATYFVERARAAAPTDVLVLEGLAGPESAPQPNPKVDPKEESGPESKTPFIMQPTAAVAEEPEFGKPTVTKLPTRKPASIHDPKDRHRGGRSSRGDTSSI